jgi:hypothetical protein
MEIKSDKECKKITIECTPEEYATIMGYASLQELEANSGSIEDHIREVLLQLAN